MTGATHSGCLVTAGTGTLRDFDGLVVGVVVEDVDVRIGKHRAEIAHHVSDRDLFVVAGDQDGDLGACPLALFAIAKKRNPLIFSRGIFRQCLVHGFCVAGMNAAVRRRGYTADLAWLPGVEGMFGRGGERHSACNSAVSSRKPMTSIPCAFG